jgi:AcrR family transcriptional regulator
VKQGERSLRTRDAILREADLLFGHDGFEATTVDQIARSAGVAKGAVYHHFSGKREIFEAVFERAAAGIAHSLMASTDHSAPILDSLISSTRSFFEMCGNPAAMQILLKDAPTVLGYERWKELDAQYFAGMVASGLANAMDRGAIARHPLQPLSRMMLSAIQSAALECASSADFNASAQEYLATLEAILRGLAER